MKYKAWDKKSDINGQTALELIGEEQMQNDDLFIIFSDDAGAFLSLESVATLKAIYGFKGTTVDAVAAEYIEYKKNEKPVPTPEEQIKTLQAQLAIGQANQISMQKAIDDLILGGAL